MEEQNASGGGVVLDIGRCFNDAVKVYKSNILMLVLASLLSTVVSLITLLILMAPITGGYCYMMLNAMRREDKRIELKDMFSMLKMFWPLFGLFWLQGLAIFAGALLLILPGIFLAIVWMFSIFVMVDKSTGIKESLKISWNAVMKGGFWMNFALIVIYFAIVFIPSYIPIIGLFAGFFVSPFAALLTTSAYRQQVEEAAIDGPVDAATTI